MISVESLTKYFATPKGRKYVFRDLNFCLEDHVNVGILGSNGAGKTTLINIIAGIETPTAGRVRTTESISWPLGLTNAFQGGMTGFQSARFVCRIHGCSGKTLVNAVSFVKEFSELGNYFNMPVSTYSTGMRARLGFALSMAFEFDTLLIDEAMAPGDARFREKANKVLADRRAQCRVIMVSHSLMELSRSCEAGILIQDGQARFYQRFEDAMIAYAGEEVANAVRNGRYNPDKMPIRPNRSLANTSN